jgi:hypothetical protein
MGPRQIILGLVIDMNKMAVGMTNGYIQQCRGLLNLWDHNQRFFKVGDMQKLIRKLAGLGKRAPWIYKLMSHLYTSLAFALKSNAELLKKAQEDPANTSSKSRCRPFWASNRIISTMSTLP